MMETDTNYVKNFVRTCANDKLIVVGPINSAHHDALRARIDA